MAGRKNLGKLRPRYRFALNKYTDFRASRCPRCRGLTFPRKFALLIHVDPDELRVLGKTSKYCAKCEFIIVHQDELESELAAHFQPTRPAVVGNKYFVLGTVDRRTWREGLEQPKTLDELLAQTADFKEYLRLDPDSGGWRREEAPVERSSRSPKQPARGPSNPPAARQQPAHKAANYTELTYQVVQQSPDPLPFTEILARVVALAPMTTKDLSGTIRSTVSQGRQIVATGNGRYGWLPRLITGAVLRVPIEASGLSATVLRFPDEVRDALWPAFFEIEKRNVREPVQVRQPDGSWTEWPLEFLGEANWGTRASPQFWQWMVGLGARPGDSLIVTALDGEARQFAVAFEHRQDRDEASIAARNAEIWQAVVAYLQKRPRAAGIPWEITPHLLATGRYQHPVPPDPLEIVSSALSKNWTVWDALHRGQGRGE